MARNLFLAAEAQGRHKHLTTFFGFHVIRYAQIEIPLNERDVNLPQVVIVVGEPQGFISTCGVPSP
jgi:hypothetical protein